jgi:hypothetical protein
MGIFSAQKLVLNISRDDALRSAVKNRIPGFGRAIMLAERDYASRVSVARNSSGKIGA